MRKFLIAGAILVALIAVVAIVATNLEGIVNKNKDYILGRAETTLGREVSIGKIGITLRGGLGVRLEDVKVGEDPVFGPGPFVEASDLQVNVKILPLLKKEFQVKRVILRDPLIRIVKNKSGVLSTQSLVRRAPAQGRPEATSAPGDEAATGATATVPLAVSLANIENGEVQYVDESQGLSVRIHKIDTSVRDFDLEKPLSIEIEAALFSDEKNLEARGTVGPLPVANREGGNAPPPVPVEFQGAVEPLELASLFGALPRMAQGIPKDVRLDGPVATRFTARGMSTDMELTLEIDGTRVSVTGPQGVKKSPGVPLGVNVNGRLTPQKFVVSSSSATLAAARFTGNGEYVLTAPPTIALEIRSEDIDLSGWETMVPAVAPHKLSGKARLNARIQGELIPGGKLPVSGMATIIGGSATVPQVVNPVTAVQSEIAFTENRAEIRDASLRIGGSRIDGRATIASFQPMTLEYEVKSASLSLADIRPPQSTVKKPEHLDGLVARGRLTVDQASKEASGGGTVASAAGSVANVDYKTLEAAYTVDGKTIRIDSLSASALDGEIRGGGVITASGTGSVFDITLKADKVDLTELLVALPGSVHKSLRGTANLDLKIAGSGKEWPDVQQSLKGTGLAELTDGEILDVNFASEIFDEIGQYVGGANLLPAALKSKYPAVFEDKNTSFENLKSDFVIDSGRLLARNLQLTHNDYGIQAKGSLGFDRSLDVGATFVVSKKLAEDLARNYPAASYLKNARGEIELPLVLSGTIPKVAVKPDVEYFRNLVQKGIVEKGIDAAKKDLLKRLLPGETKAPSPTDTTKTR